ncbi:c2H2-type domain-containing protein [Trichonephila clavata]|uniref:C2H2-type domain-containing protein n=1 Tax=Trichonephila clavata TaxID=2740835 RepID=A0A8X6LUP5_TRICU|nr:c2H2-type domain-containing protein [Trichonephila clavata]
MIQEKLPKLRVIEGPKARRDKKKKKLAPILTGEPGTRPLAPVPDSPTAPVMDVATTDGDDQASLRGRIDLARPCTLSSFIEPLDALLEVEEINNRMLIFNDIAQGVVQTVQDHFRLSVPPNRSNSTGNRSGGLDLANPQKVQSCYRWNRRKCVRALTQPSSARCPVKLEETFNYFKGIWETVGSPAERPFPEPPTRPPVVEILSKDFVADCLRSCENSSPGEDLISYRHWREIDPSCTILTKIFNICLQVADIPTSWKSSRTILIHKKGELDRLDNWRPISLSNTIYKLFTKCMARKLSDWCEMNEVLSSAQRGFHRLMACWSITSCCPNTWSLPDAPKQTSSQRG